MKGAKLIQTRSIAFQGTLGTSWQYWFKWKDLVFNIHQGKGLDISQA
jgi:hypothetical protein